MEFLNQLDMNNSKVTEVATPTSGTDAANKDYVDTGLALKAPLASPTITLAGDDLSDKLDGTEADFYKNLSASEKEKYKYIYANSLNTATSKLKWSDATEFVFTEVELLPKIKNDSYDYVTLPYSAKRSLTGEFTIDHIYSDYDKNKFTAS